MADDDEVDILGDFNFSLEGGSSLLDNTPLVSQNSDLLNCDYTIHPQWLLDKPSANPDNWYEENSATTTPDVSDSDTMGHVSTENCITDESGWTEKEKNLLQGGLEIFGRSSIRLSQFVGSKTASEVRYYLKNFFTDNLGCYQQPAAGTSIEVMPGRVSPDVLDSNQIPASIEEVIAVVSTGYPTVSLPTNKKPRRKSSSSNTSSGPRKSSPNQKLANLKRKSPEKFQASKRQIKIKFRSEQMSKQKHVRFKTEDKFISKKHERSNFEVQNELTQKSSANDIGQYLEEDSSATTREITTGRGLSVRISEGEEIVKIEQAEDESSDVSIDIEDVDPFISNQEQLKKNIEENIEMEKQVSIQQINPVAEVPKVEDKASNEEVENVQLSEEIIKQLDSSEIPQSELVLDHNVVTELEKYVNWDFFDGRLGRSSKTPERYLKIRNHIINSWNSAKPNYVFKTSMRLGLKNCGDVTCISRIHHFLEQIGAINFGCEQTKYERPLGRTLQIFEVSKSRSGKQPKNLTCREPTELGPRQRIKKKFTNDGDGGCTMVHGDKGEIIDTTIINEEPAKPRPYVKKPTIRLIYCRPFTVDKPQEYSVKISLSTLILMDFHSHSYLTEVMGMVGGNWDYQEGTLKICCYEPCKNLASSTTHCDMCPISQARAAENMHNKNFEILGWFHSHPTFAPEPSQQDLDTQQFVQQWIGHGKPCIGVILSPFSMNGALISSPFRCWMVDKKPNFEDQLVPYRFKVDVVADDFDLAEFLESMRNILYADDENMRDKRIPLHKPYFQDVTISHLDKFIYSVTMHLAKSGTLNRSKCDEILQGIRGLLKGDI